MLELKKLDKKAVPDKNTPQSTATVRLRLYFEEVLLQTCIVLAAFPRHLLQTLLETGHLSRQTSGVD